MDSARTKIVEVEGVRYVIRRMTPFDGSYIWHRLLHATLLLGQEQEQTVSRVAVEEPTEEPRLDPDQRVRALCGMAYMKLTASELREVQEKSMKVLSALNEAQLPIPVMADSGQWTPGGALEDNAFLVTRLTTEVLAYNLAGFIEAGR